MNVIYASDNSGMDLLLVSMYSLFKHNKRASVFVLQSDLTERNKARLRKLAPSKGQLKILDFDEKQLRGVKIVNTRLPLQSFYRILIPNLFKDLEKALWMDIDTLCLGSLNDLYETPLSNFWVAGVLDGGIKYVEGFTDWYKKFAGNNVYINGGILLMNLQKMRKDDKTRELLDMAVKQHTLMGKFNLFAEQTTTNVVLKGGIKLLPEKYNYMLSCATGRNPLILHFSGDHRPFTHYSIKKEYMDLYWYYYKEVNDILPDFDEHRLIKNALRFSSAQVAISTEAFNPERAELLSRIQTLQERIDLEVSELKIYRDEPNLNTSAKLLRKALRKETAAKHRQISSKVKLR
jgi:lipopolysaccharide biosynthesis glycosyltransferase